MKILLVTQYYYPENVVISKIAEQLVFFGHRVTVVTAKPNYGFDKILEEYKRIKHEFVNGVEIYRIKIHPRKRNSLSVYLNYLSFFFKAKAFLRHFKGDFDVILSSSLSPVISISPAIMYKRKHHLPLALQLLDLWPESLTIARNITQRNLIYKIFYRWSKKIYAACDEIYVSSPSFKNYLQKELELNVDNVYHLYQPSMIEANTNSPYIFKKGINIVYVGNINEVQKISYLLSLGSFFKDHGIRMHLVGTGNYAQVVKEYIKKEQLEDNLIYHGPIPVSFATRYFVNADALYLSLTDQGSVGKTIPSKLTTYMAFAKPIIGMISGDGADLLKAANGAIVCKQSKEALREAFETFLRTSTTERSQMGKNNYQYYHHNLSLEIVSKEFEKRLLALIAKAKE